MIAIIDYDAGNVKSVQNALKKLGFEAEITSDIETIINADKVIFPGVREASSAVKNPDLIKTFADKFGSQCVVVAIDSKQSGDEDYVFVNGGRIKTDYKTHDWAKKVEELGAGEILLTSMDFDGTKQGFDVRLLNEISSIVNIPIIASGGAGKMEDFTEVFNETKATGALAASIFHFGEININDLKHVLKQQNIAIRF
ncbi:MAG: HisA/HisF-related TIM barrel protein [Cloacibacterium caeni]